MNRTVDLAHIKEKVFSQKTLNEFIICFSSQGKIMMLKLDCTAEARNLEFVHPAETRVPNRLGQGGKIAQAM